MTKTIVCIIILSIIIMTFASVYLDERLSNNFMSFSQTIQDSRFRNKNS